MQNRKYHHIKTPLIIEKMLSSSHSDVDGWLEKLKVDKKFLEEKDLQILCSKVKELLSAESTV